MKYRLYFLVVFICTLLTSCGEYGALYLPKQHNGGIVKSDKKT